MATLFLGNFWPNRGDYGLPGLSSHGKVVGRPRPGGTPGRIPAGFRIRFRGLAEPAQICSQAMSPQAG